MSCNHSTLLKPGNNAGTSSVLTATPVQGGYVCSHAQFFEIPLPVWIGVTVPIIRVQKCPITTKKSLHPNPWQPPLCSLHHYNFVISRTLQQRTHAVWNKPSRLTSFSQHNSLEIHPGCTPVACFFLFQGVPHCRMHHGSLFRSPSLSKICFICRRLITAQYRKQGALMRVNLAHLYSWL